MSLLNRLLCHSAKTAKHIYINWSSTEYNNNNAWNLRLHNGNMNNNNKNNTYRVRAVRASLTKFFLLCRAFARQSFIKLLKIETILQLSLFDIPQQKSDKDLERLQDLQASSN